MAQDDELARAQAAKRLLLERLEPLDKVVGVGITRVHGAYAVKVNLREPLAPGEEPPAEIGGVPVEIEVVGTLRPR